VSRFFRGVGTGPADPTNKNFYAHIIATSRTQEIKLVNLVLPDVRFYGQNASNSISALAPPQTPLGSLQRSPRPLAVFKGPNSKGRDGKEGGDVGDPV